MIAKMELNDALYVCQRMRAADYHEIMANRWEEDYVQVAQDAYNTPGVKYAVLNKQGLPVVIFGVAFVYPRVGSGWLIATDDLPAVRLETTKACKKVVETLLRGDIHRIQADSVETHDWSHEWLETIGFKRESVMPGYGKNGETFYRYAALRG